MVFKSARQRMAVMAKLRCKGVTFPKSAPFFAIQKKNIIKKTGTERLGTIIVGKRKVFAVEDGFTITRYKRKNCAVRHFNNNVKINKELRGN